MIAHAKLVGERVEHGQLAGIEAFEELAKDVKLLPVTTKVKSIRVG